MFRSPFPIIYTADVGRALAFYRDLLGATVTYRFPDGGEPVFAALRLGEGDQRGELAVALVDRDHPTAHGRDTPFEMCIYTDDTDAAVDYRS